MYAPSDIKLAVIGLGYVGLPLAVEFGKIRPVIGFDINSARVAELQAGQDHTLECSTSRASCPAALPTFDCRGQVLGL